MIDFLLLVGRLLLVALLYLFLFFVMKTGIGLVKGQNKKEPTWNLTVERGPRTLRGTTISITGATVVGRAPGADILIPEDVVSGRHARFSLMGTSLLLEDLESLNGTFLNGTPVTQPVTCSAGDVVTIGTVEIKVGRK